MFSNVTEEITATECCTIKQHGNTYKDVNTYQGKTKLEIFSFAFKV